MDNHLEDVMEYQTGRKAGKSMKNIVQIKYHLDNELTIAQWGTKESLQKLNDLFFREFNQKLIFELVGNNMYSIKYDLEVDGKGEKMKLTKDYYGVLSPESLEYSSIGLKSHIERLKCVCGGETVISGIVQKEYGTKEEVKVDCVKCDNFYLFESVPNHIIEEMKKRETEEV